MAPKTTSSPTLSKRSAKCRVISIFSEDPTSDQTQHSLAEPANTGSDTDSVTQLEKSPRTISDSQSGGSGQEETSNDSCIPVITTQKAPLPQDKLEIQESRKTIHPEAPATERAAHRRYKVCCFGQGLSRTTTPEILWQF